MATAELPVLGFPSAEAFAAWLAKEHGSSAGVWLKIAKPAADEPSVTYDEALDVALCFGWIDGQKRGLDEAYWLQRFTPRRGRSRWSRRNREKAEALISAGRMQRAGLQEVEVAKADGRWEAAYAGSRTAEVPDDLQQALDAVPAAAEFFAALDRQNRYAVLYRVQDAKRAETRARRIATFVEMLAEGRTIYPQRKGRGTATQESPD